MRRDEGALTCQLLSSLISTFGVRVILIKVCSPKNISPGTMCPVFLTALSPPSCLRFSKSHMQHEVPESYFHLASVLFLRNAESTVTLYNSCKDFGIRLIYFFQTVSSGYYSFPPRAACPLSLSITACTVTAPRHMWPCLWIRGLKAVSCSIINTQPVFTYIILTLLLLSYT